MLPSTCRSAGIMFANFDDPSLLALPKHNQNDLQLSSRILATWNLERQVRPCMRLRRRRTKMRKCLHSLERTKVTIHLRVPLRLLDPALSSATLTKSLPNPTRPLIPLRDRTSEPQLRKFSTLSFFLEPSEKSPSQVLLPQRSLLPSKSMAATIPRYLMLPRTMSFRLWSEMLSQASFE